MLKLKNITKTYKGIKDVTALKDVSLAFRESEFVSILGPSGCGKTTLLNVIGGLDQYDSGDLIIRGLSTKQFKSVDWDAYRNRTIGFVFQSYNLIGHQNVLQNVEIAMTFSGVSASERKKRALKALEDVGIVDQAKKKPNQLSGGQMQRVAIARALVNNPDVILADEPTGALDTETSSQIMAILKEISKTRLVIMVTHNPDLASEYSSRIIKLLDGEVQSDTNPIKITKDYIEPEIKKTKLKLTSMSLATAAVLSFKNLLSKRGRTISTSLAGSIGIIGVALVLALSTGLSAYIDKTQTDTLAGFPITINTNEQITRQGPPDFVQIEEDTTYQKFPDDLVVYSFDEEVVFGSRKNIINENYLNYIEDLSTKLPEAVNNISYTHEININLLAKGQEAPVKFDSLAAFGQMDFGQIGVGSAYWQELPENNDFILSIYDLIGQESRMPENKNEVLLVVDEYNRINKEFFEKIGVIEDIESYKITDFIGEDILKVFSNNDYYTKVDNLYLPQTPQNFESLYNSGLGQELKVVGVLRPKEDASSIYLSPGLAYPTALTNYVLDLAKDSEIAKDQITSDKNLLLGTPFKDAQAKEEMLIMLGAKSTPTGIEIYPKDFNSKDEIKEYLDSYNLNKDDVDQVIYTDMAEAITEITGTLLNTVTLVLVGFAAISLIVSTIMISIITYVSVIERTREIGILRSVGARKRDISRVFNAETLIIGFSSGILGVGISYLLTIGINNIIYNLTDIANVATLTILHSILLVLGSMALTLIAGFIPAKSAAKKDPVTALRSE